MFGQGAPPGLTQNAAATTTPALPSIRRLSSLIKRGGWSQRCVVVGLIPSVCVPVCVCVCVCVGVGGGVLRGRVCSARHPYSEICHAILNIQDEQFFVLAQ